MSRATSRAWGYTSASMPPARTTAQEFMTMWSPPSPSMEEESPRFEDTMPRLADTSWMISLKSPYIVQEFPA